MKNVIHALLFAVSIVVSCVCLADESASSAGDEFRATALAFEKKAKLFKGNARSGISAIYSRQAEIKRNAATLADQGRWDEIDWSEYQANENKLRALMGQ